MYALAMAVFMFSLAGVPPTAGFIGKFYVFSAAVKAGYIWLAIGRRNYIGARSERGTKVAGTFYTVFESARICGADPEAYLRYAAESLLSGDVPLLPHEWAAASPS
jgi:hypothetical protein